MASSVPVSDSFQFDGTTSDLAQQFYRRHRAGYKADKLEVTPTAAITSRVEALDLTFDELPGLLQRALIWDSGFVFTLKNDLMAVKTLDGRSMDQIAVSLASYLEVGCKTQECDTPNQRAKWYKNGQCNGAQMISAALCAMDMLPHDEEAQMSMWSTGGEPTSVPDMIAYHHHWTDSQTRVIYAMHVIHTRSKALSPKYGECSPGSSENTGIGSLVIPCAPTKALNGTTAARFQAPKPGKIVSAWLNEYKESRSVPATIAPASSASPNKGGNTDTTTTDSKPSSNHTTLLVIVSIIGVAILLVLLIVIFVLRKRRRYDNDDGRRQMAPRIPSTPFDYSNARTPERSGEPNRPSRSHTRSTNTTATIPTSHSNHLTRGSAAYGRSSTHKAPLLDDAVILSCRLPMDALEFGQHIGRGGYGEVFYGKYREREVAIKRLLPQHRQSAGRVDAFLAEAKMMAGLEHERIVTLVG
ncbi:hypothetical protein ATCC90586_008938 [Pythium insidiosum]|nr:hypothetical protein ATCC90586_008938 [Pythium insidiosum]